jgi:two-component system OmpR family sensor kinase
MMTRFAPRRPGRLFWKLFVAFLLASGTSFLIGAGMFAFARPDAAERAVFDALPFNRTMPLMIGTVVSLFFSAGLAWYLARPITHLSRGFRAIADGQLATRVHPLVGTRRDEIADLTRDFDGMAAQLQHLLQTQERLFHDVSHELRSPLSRLQLAIGLLRQSPEKIPDMLLRVEREAERLNSLIEELLTLARLKSSSADFGVSPVDLIDLLTAIVDDANFEGRAKGCTIHYAPAAAFVVMGNGDLLYRAFENVIRNAVKFSPPDTRVDVTTDISDDRAVVSIRDRGRGVPAGMEADIFEPFKRADTEGAEVSGFGLGLAIAKYALEWHGGTIRATAADGGGLAMTVMLPRRTLG